MIIQCKKCKANFNLDESLLKASGSRVRCSLCRHSFVAYPPISPKEPADPNNFVQVLPTPGADQKTQYRHIPIENQDLNIPIDDDNFDGSLEEVESNQFVVEPGETDFLDMADILETDLDIENELIAEEVQATGHSSLSSIDRRRDIPESDEETVFDPDKLELSGGSNLGLGTDPNDGEDYLEMETEAALTTVVYELDSSDIERLLDPASEGEAVQKQTDTEPSQLDLSMGPSENEAIKEEIENAVEDRLELSDIDEMLYTQVSENPISGAKQGLPNLGLELESEEATPFEMNRKSEIARKRTFVFDSTKTEEALEMEFLDPTDVQELRADDHVDFKIDDAQETKEPQESIEKSIEIESALDDLQELWKSGLETIEPGPSGGNPIGVAKRRPKPILVLLTIVVLIGGGYGIYSTLGNMGIGLKALPIISELTDSGAHDINKAIILQDSVSYKFITNSKTGELFAIEGQVKNGYSEARRFFKVRGKLFSKGNTLASAKTVYCGNMLTNPELSSLDMDTITKRLQNRSGDKNTNSKVEPGKAIAFMIVFSNLPEELEEYEVAPAGSLASH
jgi:pilus assembly protein FimV